MSPQDKAKYKIERAIRRCKKKNQLSYYERRAQIMSRQSMSCDECGGQMSWCQCCEMWSRGCCVDYGTCQCS